MDKEEIGMEAILKKCKTYYEDHHTIKQIKYSPIWKIYDLKPTNENVEIVLNGVKEEIENEIKQLQSLINKNPYKNNTPYKTSIYMLEEFLVEMKDSVEMNRKLEVLKTINNYKNTEDFQALKEYKKELRNIDWITKEFRILCSELIDSYLLELDGVILIEGERIFDKTRRIL